MFIEIVFQYVEPFLANLHFHILKIHSTYTLWPQNLTLISTLTKLKLTFFVSNCFAFLSTNLKSEKNSTFIDYQQSYLNKQTKHLVHFLTSINSQETAQSSENLVKVAQIPFFHPYSHTPFHSHKNINIAIGFFNEGLGVTFGQALYLASAEDMWYSWGARERLP